MCKKLYNWNRATCICMNGKYLRSIIDNSVIMCDEIISTVRNVSTTVTSNLSIDFKTDSYILYIILLLTILLLEIGIIC